MRILSIRRQAVLAVGTASLLIASFAGSAVASAATVTTDITGGTLTATIADATLPSSIFQNTEHLVTGDLALSAEDTTASGLGWNVTVLSSAFVYSGTAAGGVLNNIAADQFTLRTAALPVWVSGQVEVDTTAFPAAGRVVPVTLNTARMVVSATAAYGQGSYTQALGVDLLIPAMAPIGTYTATLTVTITSGA